MNQRQQAHNRYSQVKRETASDKHIELQLFASITGKLRTLKGMGDQSLTPDMAQAVLENAKLWNLLFCDLVSKENALPIEIKNNLISLAEFTQNHTHKVLRAEATADILVEINDSIIQGLKSALKSQTNIANNQKQNQIQEVA